MGILWKNTSNLDRFQNLFLNRERERNRCKAKGEILIWVNFYCFSQPSFCVPCLRSFCGIPENYAQISSFPFNSLSPADIRLYSGVPSYCTKCFLCSNPHLLTEEKDQYCLFLISQDWVIWSNCCISLGIWRNTQSNGWQLMPHTQGLTSRG